MRHRHHRWVAVSCQSEDHSRYDDEEFRFDGGRTIPQTLVLQLCRCGGFNIVRLDGAWSREELGIDARVVADLYKILHKTEAA